MKRLFIAAFILLSSCTTQAIPQIAIPPKTENNEVYFVQVWTENASEDMSLFEEEDPGRIEVYEGNDVNNTIACIQLKSVKDWNQEQLANVSIGFTYYGNQKNLHIKAYGAAGRLVKINTKVIEHPVVKLGG